MSINALRFHSSDEKKKELGLAYRAIVYDFVNLTYNIIEPLSIVASVPSCWACFIMAFSNFKLIP